jgi:hypothetical protein
MVKPAVPARRSHRSLGNAVIDHPSPLEPKRWIDARFSIVGVPELVIPDQLAIATCIEACV